MYMEALYSVVSVLHLDLLLSQQVPKEHQRIFLGILQFWWSDTHLRYFSHIFFDLFFPLCLRLQAEFHLEPLPGCLDAGKGGVNLSFLINFLKQIIDDSLHIVEVMGVGVVAEQNFGEVLVLSFEFLGVSDKLADFLMVLFIFQPEVVDLLL